MKEKMMTMILALVLSFSVAGAGWAAPPPMMETPARKTQVACPVQGGKINKDLYVDYQGERVYFCCPACIPIFNKDPENYLRKMRGQGVMPEKTPGGK
jgi:YHS domain-containing protein